MIAAMATFTGPNPALADIARMARDEIEGWLRGYDGFRGLIILTDQDGERARVITLWADAEAEANTRQARGAMREKVATVAGMQTEPMELYEVPVWEPLT
jgi:heme-degrading monooxygenase HmoA